MERESAVKVLSVRFVNSDARPKVTVIFIRADGIADVMRWYGSHHAGDRYSVFVNGVKVAKDQNGELVGDLQSEALQ